MVPAPDLPIPPDLAGLDRDGPIALFLDFDGTLVDIAATPDGIDVPPTLSDGLRGLAERLDGRLAVVTGRAVDDLAGHFAIDGIACAGSHGAHRLAANGQPLGHQPQALESETMDRLRLLAAELSVEVEEKAHGAALHYRSDPSKERQVREAVETLAEQFGLDTKRGKCVIELVRPGADKGGAVRAFLETEPFRGAKPVFVGDDVTDEDGFSACAELGGFGIIVGDRTPTDAHYRLASVDDVFQWLDL